MESYLSKRYEVLPSEGNSYKANLHCHSTMSDGKLEPAQIKRLYRSMGYSIVAFTDHELLSDHSSLTEDGFLAMTGYEVALNGDSPVRSYTENKLTHLTLLAPRPDYVTHVCYDPGAVWADPMGIRDRVPFHGRRVRRVNTPAWVNRVIREANRHGFLVTYNHPSLSLANYDDYKKLHGLFAIEVMNGGSMLAGLGDSAAPYDHLLRLGNRLNCLGADDNHNRHPVDSPNSDSGRAWVVIRAKSLDYPEVFAALKRGHFYSSSGPEIKTLYIEGGVLHVSCSPAQSIIVNSSGRATGVLHAKSGAEVISAQFQLRDDFYDYIRVTVEDSRGMRAYSNAVFMKDIADRH